MELVFRGRIARQLHPLQPEGEVRDTRDLQRTPCRGQRQQLPDHHAGVVHHGEPPVGDHRRLYCRQDHRHQRRCHHLHRPLRGLSHRMALGVYPSGGSGNHQQRAAPFSHLRAGDLHRKVDRHEPQHLIEQDNDRLPDGDRQIFCCGQLCCPGKNDLCRRQHPFSG
ncbi:hypothetical protein DSECCO2_624010 [anaerobic digester metagenome]